MAALTRAKASPERKSSLKKDQDDQIKSIKRASDAEIKVIQKNSFLERFKQSDVDGLEKFADRLLKKFKIDVEFTRHFVDRLNDPRNSPDIKIAELQRLFKKIKKNKKYFFSKKDQIFLESLKIDGIEISNKFDDLYQKNDSEIPTDLQVMINNDEKGAALMRIVEVIGQDKLERIDEDTIYFIVHTLNQLNIDQLRNSILLKVLPLKV